MNKIRSLIIVSAAFVLSSTAFAQVEPPLPPQATNAIGALTTFSAGLNLLPAWDKTATNSFNSGELTIASAPLWKTMTAAGSTPYASIAGNYFLTRSIGVGGELITFGDGQGNSSVDSGLVNFTLRKDIGNIAGYLMGGAGYDWNTKRPMGAFGPGVIYRYTTGLGFFIDNRWAMEGTAKEKNGWLTRIGLELHF